MKLMLELDDWQVAFIRDQLRVRVEDALKNYSGPYEKDDWARHYASRIMSVRHILKMNDGGDMYLPKDALA